MSIPFSLFPAFVTLLSASSVIISLLEIEIFLKKGWEWGVLITSMNKAVIFTNEVFQNLFTLQENTKMKLSVHKIQDHCKKNGWHIYGKLMLTL